MRMELMNEELLDKVAGGVGEPLTLNQLIEFAEGFQVKTLEDMKNQLKLQGLTASEEDIKKGFNQYLASFM